MHCHLRGGGGGGSVDGWVERKEGRIIKKKNWFSFFLSFKYLLCQLAFACSVAVEGHYQRTVRGRLVAAAGWWRWKRSIRHTAVRHSLAAEILCAPPLRTQTHSKQIEIQKKRRAKKKEENSWKEKRVAFFFFSFNVMTTTEKSTHGKDVRGRRISFDDVGQIERSRSHRKRRRKGGKEMPHVITALVRSCREIDMSPESLLLLSLSSLTAGWCLLVEATSNDKRSRRRRRKAKRSKKYTYCSYRLLFSPAQVRAVDSHK